MEIGFFGDSFSAERKGDPTVRYKTYISLLEKEYNTKIKVHSYGGSSHWDVIINQFLPNKNNLPDICIFTWPDENRMFHRKIRHIRQAEALEYSKIKYKFFKISYSFGLFKKQWEAAEMYYRYLYDEEKNNLEYISSLHYFDNVILKNIKNKKFIHLWSFEKKYNWTNSIELETPLLKIAESHIPDYHENGKNTHYLAPNHLPTQELNDYVFKQIKGLIDEVSR